VRETARGRPPGYPDRLPTGVCRFAGRPINYSCWRAAGKGIRTANW